MSERKNTHKVNTGTKEIRFRNAFSVNCLRSSKCHRRQLESVHVGQGRGRGTLIEILLFPSQADYARNVFHYRLLFPVVYSFSVPPSNVFHACLPQGVWHSQRAFGVTLVFQPCPGKLPSLFLLFLPLSSVQPSPCPLPSIHPPALLPLALLHLCTSSLTGCGEPRISPLDVNRDPCQTQGHFLPIAQTLKYREDRS